MDNENDRLNEAKPESNKPEPDPILISHVEKGYTPEDLEKGNKK